jgi:hypothetical protein
LVDGNDKIMKENEGLGEIHIRNSYLMSGYLNNGEATSEAFTSDGWIRSGDVGYVKEGRWYIVDRTKDLIKVCGWQVSPAEIECVLLQHPGVVDAAVIGIKTLDGSGETPHAFVVRKGQRKLDEKDIMTFLAGRLARYKGVSKVEFVDTIPRNPTGKIPRRILRDSVYKETPPKSPNAEAVLAYSKAIYSLEKCREKRGCGVSSPTSSLSGTSSISIADPSTPPDAAEVPSLERENKKRGYMGGMEEHLLIRNKRRSTKLVAKRACN